MALSLSAMNEKKKADFARKEAEAETTNGSIQYDDKGVGYWKNNRDKKSSKPVAPKSEPVAESPTLSE